MNVNNYKLGNVPLQLVQDYPVELESFSYLEKADPIPKSARQLGLGVGLLANGLNVFWHNDLMDFMMLPVGAAKVLFPPQVALHLVRLACERPDRIGRSLSQWDCQELARQLVAEGVTESISSSTVQRILASHKLKPWRHHLWMNPKHPRDEAFYQTVSQVSDLYNRLVRNDEIILSVDEKTSLQPRPRCAATLPAHPGNIPNRHEHEYKRDGALNLFAALDTRSGKVYGQCFARKRQIEFIQFLEYLDSTIHSDIKTIHILCDNVSTHHGKKVQAWLAQNRRFVFHFTPVHCSWMNQVEQWFSILQRKRFTIADFASKKVLKEKIEQFIVEWNQQAHPFKWTQRSFDKIMAKQQLKKAA